MSCAICLDDTCQKEYYVTTCNHVFHNSCLLKVNNIYRIYNKNDKVQFECIKCPICRKEQKYCKQTLPLTSASFASATYADSDDDSEEEEEYYEYSL